MNSCETLCQSTSDAAAAQAAYVPVEPSADRDQPVDNCVLPNHAESHRGTPLPRGGVEHRWVTGSRDCPRIAPENAIVVA